MVSLGEKAEWWSSGLGSEHSWIMQQTTVFIKLPNQVTRKTQVQWGSAKVDILTCYPLKSYFCSCSAPCSQQLSMLLRELKSISILLHSHCSLDLGKVYLVSGSPFGRQTYQTLKLWASILWYFYENKYSI